MTLPCLGPCKLDLPVEEFHRKSASPRGYQEQCKACRRAADKIRYAKNPEKQRARSRANYRKAPEKHKAITRRNGQRLLAENRAKVLAYLQSHPCVDCHEADPVVLAFDHRDPCEKDMNVGVLLNNKYTWRRIEAEIAKCDVRCANCHRRRTARQFPNYRLPADASEALL